VTWTPFWLISRLRKPKACNSKVNLNRGRLDRDVPNPLRRSHVIAKSLQRLPSVLSLLAMSSWCSLFSCYRRL
jgi:hypothetical protein